MNGVKGFNPLPEGIELKKSKIHGYGLFATINLNAQQDLGITHVADTRFPDGYIRTPLGSYANHSHNPNLKGIQDRDTYHFITLREIKAGEELVVDYRDFNYDQGVLASYI